MVRKVCILHVFPGYTAGTYLLLAGNGEFQFFVHGSVQKNILLRSRIILVAEKVAEPHCFK